MDRRHGLPAGRYWVRFTVDPHHLVADADLSNTAEFPVDLGTP